MKLRITDILSHEATVEVEHDDIADTLTEWFFGADDGTFAALNQLQNSWTPGSQNAHEQDALGTLLGVHVALAE